MEEGIELDSSFSISVAFVISFFLSVFKFQVGSPSERKKRNARILAIGIR